MQTLKLELELTRREADELMRDLSPRPWSHPDLQSAVGKLVNALISAGR